MVTLSLDIFILDFDRYIYIFDYSRMGCLTLLLQYIPTIGISGCYRIPCY
jgi:hypothetical protein